MTIEMTDGDARLVVDPDDGCRLTSFQLGEHELLAEAQDEPWGYGSFVMAPWAGRLRDGRATWGTLERTYTVQDDGHALHGLVHSAVWDQVADDTWEIAVDDWLAPCVVRQRIVLGTDSLHLGLEVTSEVDVPVTVGWHPWFRRRLGNGDPVRIEVRAAGIHDKEPDGSTSLRRAAVPPKPWDDTFVDVRWPVGLSWPGAVDLEITSDAPVAVIFDELPVAVCVEPQSGPPNEVNLRPRLATPDRPLTLSSTWRWRLD